MIADCSTVFNTTFSQTYDIGGVTTPSCLPALSISFPSIYRRFFGSYKALSDHFLKAHVMTSRK